MAEMGRGLQLDAPKDADILRIGIQIRVGDQALRGPDDGTGDNGHVDHYKSFFDCAKEIESHAKQSNTTKVTPTSSKQTEEEMGHLKPQPSRACGSVGGQPLR